MLTILNNLKVSPLLTSSIIDMLLKSEYNIDGKVSLTDDQLYELALPYSLTPGTIMRLLSANKFAITNIHTRTKTGRSDGHHYIIDLNKYQDKPIVHKVSKTSFQQLSTANHLSIEGACDKNNTKTI